LKFEDHQGFHIHAHFIIGLLQKTKEMFSNASNLGLNVEFAPLTTHMHYILIINKIQHQNSFIKTNAHEIKKQRN
jgi:hypothetical protein